MKIKCVRNFINNPDAPNEYRDMREYLPIDSLFFVFGIRFFRNVTYVYIFNEQHIFEVPIDMFEIVDESVSSEWKIKTWDSGKITLWPELFYQEDFLENFSEWEDHERSLFKDLRAKMEK